jgi:succinate dehydrogenase/fumarate reductase-like Fe-S protein
VTDNEKPTISVKIRRAPGDAVDIYEVSVNAGMSIFNVLDRIRNTLDPTLAFPMSCRIGKCDICLVKVNGETKWTCTEPASDGMELEPIDRYEVIKDLVVDFEKKAPPPERAGVRGNVNSRTWSS